MTLPAIVVAAVLAAAASVHFPASTNDPQAQADIDRGLFLYYAYDGAAAAQAFGEAASREPGLAAAFWGSALAAGPDLNSAMTAAQFDVGQVAIRHAVALSAAESGRERKFVAIMALRYAGTFNDWSEDDGAYRQAMTAFAQSSGDENAKLLAAEALLEHGGLSWANGRLASDESRTALELDEAVLRADPSNVMANHLCIHLYDLAPDRLPALPCARRLDAAVFPAQAEHLAHMPAHYWIETGDYRAALASSGRAYALLLQLEAAGEDAEHVLRYQKHDVAVGYSAAMMLGNYATAQVWSGEWIASTTRVSRRSPLFDSVAIRRRTSRRTPLTAIRPCADLRRCIWDATRRPQRLQRGRLLNLRQAAIFRSSSLPAKPKQMAGSPKLARGLPMPPAINRSILAAN